MKNTRTNKNHNNNKITKKYAFISLLLLTLGFAGVSTAIYLQPSHYKGDTFTNAKSSISTTTSSTSSSSSSQTESTNDSDTNNYYVYTESNSTEVENNNSSNQVNNNQSQQTTNNSTLTEDIVYSYVGWNYQEAIIKLKAHYGISGAVIETVETSDFKDDEIISASYENNSVHFKVAKHVDTDPYLPVGPEPSEEIESETGE